MDSRSATPSTGRRHWLLAGLLLLVVAATAFALLRERWAFRLVDLRFVDHREKVAGGGAALNVTGYVLVRVESEGEGKGSLFVLQLPAKKAAAPVLVPTGF